VDGKGRVCETRPESAPSHPPVDRASAAVLAADARDELGLPVGAGAGLSAGARRLLLRAKLATQGRLPVVDTEDPASLTGEERATLGRPFDTQLWTHEELAWLARVRRRFWAAGEGSEEARARLREHLLQQQARPVAVLDMQTAAPGPHRAGKAKPLRKRRSFWDSGDSDQDAPSAAATRPGWRCHRCDFYNAHLHTVCAQCLGMRPSEASGAVPAAEVAGGAGTAVAGTEEMQSREAHYLYRMQTEVIRPFPPPPIHSKVYRVVHRRFVEIPVADTVGTAARMEREVYDAILDASSGEGSRSEGSASLERKPSFPLQEAFAGEAQEDVRISDSCGEAAKQVALRRAQAYMARERRIRAPLQ